MSVERQLMMSSGGVQQYTISNSLRFRASASAYLSRTFSSPTSQYVWTFSAWVKRGVLGSSSYQALMATRDTGSAGIWWWGDTLTIANNGAGALVAQSTAVFRDPSAWYHVVVTSNGTTIVGYVNKQQVLSYTGTIGRFNTAVVHNIANDTQSSYYFDGYLTEVNFIDGQALTPSSFGETSSTTGVWIPKKYTGSYGTNGFYLNFNNNTSTTALGYDTSGNGNNWTPNNFSLTTGATYDSMIDSPTSYASGTNNVGNYAVLNPLFATGNVTNANLTHTASAASWVNTSSTFFVTSGKWYFEATNSGGNYTMIGVATNSASASTVYATATSTWTYFTDGTKYGNGATSTAYGAAYGNGDVIGVALDMDAGTLTFYKNNVSQGVAFSTGLSGLSLCPWFGSYTNGVGSNANFGQRPFAYTPPSGYKALNTYNLSTPSIVDGSKHMTATTYTGNGSTQTISYANFQPDLVWCKTRVAAADNILNDSVRGISRQLASNKTNAEVFYSGYQVVSFNSNGFTVTDDAAGGYGVNGASGGLYSGTPPNYVAWQWKAGGTAVTNTAGSITSSVSANTTAGFSVVTYTGNGSSGATVGHGLGVAPAFIIIKDRTAARTGDQWPTYHVSIGATGGLVYLNSSGAGIATSVVWNNTNPSSSVFTLGNWGGINYSGDAFVAYCFAAIPGYSAFGSYTGNGSTDGAFIYTGFLPKLILVKCSSSTGNWFMLDTARNTYNVIGEQLESNLSNAGSTVTTLDVLSNGFKMRTSSDPNASQTYVYAAFAASPFKNSLAF